MVDKIETPEGFEDVEDMETSEQMDIAGLESEESLEFNVGITLDVSELENTKYLKKDFIKGINDYSYVAGAITAITNAGVSAQEALTYVLNMKLVDANIKMTDARCKAQVEAAKFAIKSLEDNGV